jgi:hypothetical protein
MLDPGLHQQTVNHNLDGMVLSFVELNVILEVYQFAVHARSAEAVLD